MALKMTCFAAICLLVVVGCKSSEGSAPCPDTQAIVESVAKQYPDCTRLTVHTTPPSGGACCAVASTSAAKLGKASDPEDLDAMKTGKTVVLDEAGAVDVTVPICSNGGSYTGACGVTLKSSAAATREDLVARATLIAKDVETRMAAMKK